MKPQDLQPGATMSFEDWRAQLIRVTAEKTGHSESEITLNEEDARQWYDAGFTPEATFRENWEGDGD